MQVSELYPEDVETFQRQHREREYTLVDVRQPEEYREEHIPGALHLPLPELEDRLDQLPRDRELLFYCRSGRRSATAAALTAQSGQSFKALYNIQGGIAAWQGGIVEQVPRVDRFDMSRGSGELLRRAAAMEKGAQRFYAVLAESNALSARLRQTAAELADLEGRHAQSVHTLLTRQEAIPDFDPFFASLDDTILEGGQDLGEALAQWTQQGDLTCLDFLELALDLENKAYDLYKTLAENTAQGQERSHFLTLAEQEKAHLRVLVNHLPECG